MLQKLLKRLQKKPGHKFVFIGGLHRSGTTLLAEILAQHPQISGLENTHKEHDEGQHVQKVYPSAAKYGGPGNFAFASKAHLTEKSKLANKKNAKKIFKQWSAFWDTSKEVLLEKSPPNMIMFRFLQKLFPETYFILISRHPVAVTLATRKWNTSGLDHLFNHWITAHSLFAGDLPYLKNVLVIQYEKLMENPQSVLNHIHNFIGIENHPYRNLPINKEINSKYFATWKEEQTNNVGLFKDITAKYANKVAYFGYEL